MANDLESIKKWPQTTRDYIAELQLEMKRVTWPTRKQVESTTVVVIFCVFAFAAYFKLVDSIVNGTIVKLYSALSK
ncbi:MAG: preprotein translocase subunit SecE [Acidobacteriota bacterium]|nr:preprotein translocase subunit SecE [Acidobacteriota bacterium]